MDDWEIAIDRQVIESPQRVITFDRLERTDTGRAGSSPQDSTSLMANAPASGIRLPFMVWQEKRLTRWILALDFDESVPWNQDTWNILFHVTQRLSAILGQTDFVIRPNLTDIEPGEAIAKFLALTRDDAGIQATGAELRLRGAKGMKSVLRIGEPLPETREQDWRSVLGEGGKGKAAGYSVRQWVDGPAWSMPLWVGPFVVGDLRCSFADGPELEPRCNELFRTIPGLWSRLTCELRSPIWKPIRFRKGDTRDGVTTWKEQLVMLPLNFEDKSSDSAAVELFARL